MNFLFIYNILLLLLLLLLILLLLSIYDLICCHTQEAWGNEQPPMEAQPDQLRRERVNRDLRSLLATCTDERVCQVEHCSLRCPEVRFRDLQGESSCGPDGSRCASARLSVSMTLPSVASLTLVVPHGLLL